MSKKLEKRAARLVRKAEGRANVIRRVVREYSEAFQASSATDPARHAAGQLQIEQAVVRYNQVHKTLRRLRKRIDAKSNGDLRTRLTKHPIFR